MHESVFRGDLLELVTLRIEFTPKHILQLLDTLSGNRGYEDYRQIVRQVFLQHLYQLLIEQIAFGNSQHAMFVKHLWIEVSQLAKKHFVFLLDIIGITWHHEEQE